MHIQRIRRD